MCDSDSRSLGCRPATCYEADLWVTKRVCWCLCRRSRVACVSVDAEPSSSVCLLAVSDVPTEADHR